MEKAFPIIVNRLNVEVAIRLAADRLGSRMIGREQRPAVGFENAQA